MSKYWVHNRSQMHIILKCCQSGNILIMLLSFFSHEDNMLVCWHAIPPNQGNNKTSHLTNFPYNEKGIVPCPEGLLS